MTTYARQGTLREVARYVAAELRAQADAEWGDEDSVRRWLEILARDLDAAREAAGRKGWGA